jgi:acyl-CoA reductase-like NAD-dependent aldehyde dehydrogenase
MAIVRDLLIGGKSVPASGGRVTRDVNPCTGGVFAEVAASSPADVTAAVAPSPSAPT